MTFLIEMRGSHPVNFQNIIKKSLNIKIFEKGKPRGENSALYQTKIHESNGNDNFNK